MGKYKAEKVAFLGLGSMGQGMAANLQRKGTQLTVFDIKSERCEPVEALGARVAESLADAVKDADIVFTILPATQHVREALLGKGGVAETMPQGGIIVEMSTIAPTATDEIAAECARRGYCFIDAPVGRPATHAISGESLFMVGSDDDDAFETLRPLLDKMGTAIFRTGSVGSGVRLKVVNNFMVMATAQVTSEALLLAAKMGLDIDLLKEVTGATSATNGQFQIVFASKVLAGDTDPGFTLDLAYKDITLALDAAAALRIGLPVGAAVSAAFQQARSTSYATKDFTALLDFAAEIADVKPVRLKSGRM